MTTKKVKNDNQNEDTLKASLRGKAPQKQGGKDIKEIITNQIIEMIETGQATGEDWVLPFRSLGGRPTNASTGRPYRGLNALWLGLLGYQTVATYRQWQGLGYQVQQGSKGVLISVPKTKKDKKTGDDIVLGFRAASVHPTASVLHAESGEPWAAPDAPTLDLTERLENADNYIENLGFDIRFGNEDGAFYRPSSDYINMPPRELFIATTTSTATENYYSTLLHESAHATGHTSRLDRLDLKNEKGYAFEELVAELSAAFLCNLLQVSSEPREDHAHYLSGWLKALKNDSDYIFKAASEAQKVVDWMDKQQPDDKVEQKVA